MSIILNLALGINPAWIGFMLAFPRLIDSFSDPIIGYLSDHSRSKYGRRKPFIFLGIILAGFFFAGMWQLPVGHSESYYIIYFLAMSTIFYICYTCFATPWIALGYELTRDYDDRTRLMGISSFMGQIGLLFVPWVYALAENKNFFPDLLSGTRCLAIFIGGVVIFFGVVPTIFCKEPKQKLTPKNLKNKNSLKSFYLFFKITFSYKPFLKLCFASLFFFNGLMLVSSFSQYIILFYVYQGQADAGGVMIGWHGVVSTLTAMVAVPLGLSLSIKYGREKTFLITATISLFGCLLKGICYQPAHPWLVLLPAVFISIGLGSLFMLMNAMMADLCDFDELKTGERREGAFGSIYWLQIKLGMVIAFGISGILLNATGYDVALAENQFQGTFLSMIIVDSLLPAILILCSILIMRRYELNRNHVTENQTFLDNRLTDTD